MDDVWRKTIVRFRGFRLFEDWDTGLDSHAVDTFFMFDQAAIWVASLHSAAAAAIDLPTGGLTTAQWEALRALTFRMIEQLDAIRLLFLHDLPTPSMQIARSISEDVDMALAFVSRPKLAKRFVECTTIEEAQDFWRRHIAGGRAFKAVSERLYRAGLEFDQDGAYAAWRQQVKSILGTAVHTSFTDARKSGLKPVAGQFSETGDCLYFVTLRLQEMCAYSHVLNAEFGQDLAAVHNAAMPDANDCIGRLTPLISEVTVDQLRRMLAVGELEALHS
ncbi:hypothetical protein [Ruegeria sp. EL01]|uniref:hypothetical protein n=1 Tax=Ruegeria sp. EL01 TaxID=2107578 RepID=UPI0013C4E423|nr:hypothetical protein [Ruegeria sp. EL01]